MNKDNIFSIPVTVSDSKIMHFNKNKMLQPIMNWTKLKRRENGGVHGWGREGMCAGMCACVYMFVCIHKCKLVCKEENVCM